MLERKNMEGENIWKGKTYGKRKHEKRKRGQRGRGDTNHGILKAQTGHRGLYQERSKESNKKRIAFKGIPLKAMRFLLLSFCQSID